MHKNPPPSAAQSPRYIVGIDLGTTNCAVAFIDTKAGRTLRDFPVEQFTAAGTRERRDTLPSFLFTPPGETDRVVGVYARDVGPLTPGRLITSAKSWLCHAGVNRKAAILPWHADDDVKPISPVEAQTHILRHLREAWDTAHPDAPLADQDVYITVPASFDEVARELTVEAARAAGLPALVLLEEPQAAFYAWLSHHEQEWPTLIAPDAYILVCDIGGGTTDFTLIHARPGDAGTVNFHRTAVGDHLILGGDNLDLALAHLLEPRLAADSGGKLDPRSWTTLVRLCRHHKEVLLGDNPPGSVTVTLPGTGSSLLRGQRQATLTRDEVTARLLDGFLPVTTLNAPPARRASGFQEFGLPFAADPAISKYLGEFLRTYLPLQPDGTPTPPGAILLNGGLFESARMRERFDELMAAWFPKNATAIRRLDHRRLDLAVARGAAYFGLARRGEGVRVISNLARSYYLGVAGSAGHASTALCVAPADLAPGHSLRIDQHPLRVMLKTPVAFPVYVSSIRTTDEAGALVTPDSETFKALPPVQTVLTVGKSATQTHIDVHLTSVLTELGTLDLHIHESDGSRAWKLAFDLRAATRTDLAFHDGRGEQQGVLDADTVTRASDTLAAAFRLSTAALGHHTLARDLEVVLEQPRTAWPASVLRSLWNVLRDNAPRRRTSAIHEQRWLNLTGYTLRPGYGLALDDWRVAETWKIFHAGPIFPANDAVRAEWWILWRRIAAGLTTGQQATLGQPLLAALRQLLGGKIKARLPGGWDLQANDHELIEILRLLGSLERLPRHAREALGELLLNRIAQRGPTTDHGAALWTLGRLGARVPLHGAINDVLPAETAAAWITRLLALPTTDRDLAFTIVTLARKTGDRYRDLDDETTARLATWLRQQEAPAHWLQLIQTGGDLAAEETTRTLGDSLPIGLTLNNER